MNDNEKAHLLMKAAELHESNIRHSFRIQWQITFVLWAGIFAAIGFFGSSEDGGFRVFEKFFLTVICFCIGWIFYRYVNSQFQHRTIVRNNWKMCIKEVQTLMNTEICENIDNVIERRKKKFFDQNLLPVGVTWMFLFIFVVSIL